MRICIIPGSYDPITNGHIDIIVRAAELFDTVYVAVMENGVKKTLFTLEERKDMIQTVFENNEKIKVISSGGLLADLAKQLNACALVKGVRDISDFAYENQLAAINRTLNPKLETVLLPANAKYAHISSTAVRDISLHGGDVSDFIPKKIEPLAYPRLYEQYNLSKIIKK